ncbi:MAG: hypothetical protein GX574_12225 [Lentisphaerae bacterium]|nr:hypothetical protein [Lentisphaerota bacterium]
MMVEHDSRPHFKIHPSVVYQLGESLISDAVQALIELVKNCYDADATYAKVVIDTKGVTGVDGAIYPADGGRIIVEDDGHGMDIEDIKAGWLTISNRKKRELKQAKRTTPGGRTPLGDKGLGRLGVQRLGEMLEVFTQAKDQAGYHFGFSWLDFETAPNLEDVEIYLVEADCPRKHGTKVVISGLKEPEVWRGEPEIKRLEQELSRMISPYRQIRDFMVAVEVDGKPLELLEISDRIREIAPVRYRLTFDGNRFVIQGRARLDFFRPSDPKEAESFALIAEADNGSSFYQFLQECQLPKDLSLRRSETEPWFVEYERRRVLSDIDEVEFLTGDFGNCVANPGPFSGEVDSFDLGSTAFQSQAVFDRISEYRRHIKDLSGIRVYRDGFAIRVDQDWLKLGAQWTSAPSYYGLKPDNTLGYIALSARDNIELEEKTDREGFKDSPYYRNFYLLLTEFKNFTTTAHNFFGRSWNEFRKARNEALAQVDSRKTVEDISRAIKNGLAKASQYQESISPFRSRIGACVSASKEVVSQLRSSDKITPELRQKVAEAVSNLEALLVEAEDVVGRLSTYLEELESLRRMGQVLDDRVDGLRRQMDDMYEAVALGLTAEALSHEVYNIADQLAERAKSAQMSIRKKGITDRPLLAFIEHVHSSVMALRKQMSFLAPSLRYVRDQKHEIKLAVFSQELADFYKERLEKNGITLTVSHANDVGFSVRMNRGKLTQIVDNLVLNSEYWLREDIRRGRTKRGTITIELSRPFMRVYDDGAGIDPSVEHALFEPFISAKAKGRGLGLFIVKQLLDSEGCSIGLVPERNQHQRLYKFQIDLRGGML